MSAEHGRRLMRENARQATEERLEALAVDWHRLRDVERSWARLVRLVARLAVFVGILFLAGLLVGCIELPDRCARARAYVRAFEYCERSASCDVSPDDVVRYNRLARDVQGCEEAGLYRPRPEDYERGLP